MKEKKITAADTASEEEMNAAGVSPAEAPKGDVGRLQSIEKWAEEKGTDRAVLAGIKVMRHWGSGKNIPENDYDEAVTAFKKGAADGRKK